jgi:hypothetical protein
MAARDFFTSLGEARWERARPDPASHGVPTEQFLVASRGMMEIFKHLNPIAFEPVRWDMERKVGAVERRYNADRVRFATLQKLVGTEKAETGREDTLDALRWYVRGLHFVQTAFERNRIIPTEELAASFSGAYDSTLSKHHNVFQQNIVRIAVNAVPKRATFYRSIGCTNADAMLECEHYFNALRDIVTEVGRFYTSRGWEK